MRGKISWAVEHFVTLWTPIFHVDDPRTPMLGQTEGVIVHLLTQATYVVTDLVVDLCKFSFGFFSDLNDIVGGVDVTLPDDEWFLTLRQLPDDCTRHRRRLVLIKVETPCCFVFL